MNKIVMGLGILFVSIASGAQATPPAYSQDTGTITNLYTSNDGKIAIQFSGGFPKSNTDGQCPGNSGWAGNFSADPLMQSALLAAKISQKTVTVTTAGCEAAGSWLKVTDVYLN